ncbi:hypothetical protein PENSPDRAFT_691500 [Peniophora sp. CONT]|nr:hypothetical protein PENSPDRAFT_691500 [Peniophora sp. CONT]
MRNVPLPGISVWANVTKNATLTSFLENVVSSATTFSTWTLKNGVINEAGQSYDTDAVFKGIFVRALTEALMRNPGTALARYIEAYIYVQYDSILLNSRAPNSNFYATSWSGPTNSSFNAAGNIAALDVLNAAFGIAAIADTASGGTPSTNDTTGSRSRHLDIGAIAGGVAGGAVAVSAIIAALSLRRRRRAHAREVHSIDGSFYSSDSVDAMDTVEPFVDTPGSISQSSKRQHRRKSRMGATPSSTMAPLDLLAEQSVGSEGFLTSTSDLGRVEVPGSADFPELPALVRHLYHLMQGRQTEPPPRYES